MDTVQESDLAHYFGDLSHIEKESEIKPPIRLESIVGSTTDYGRPVRKLSSLHGRKSNPKPKFIGTAEAYFVCHIGPDFFDLCLHWVSVVCGLNHDLIFAAQKINCVCHCR